MVAVPVRGQGLGSTIMRLTLAHILIEESLLAIPGIRIVAYVHTANEMPQGIIEGALQFKHSRDVEIPAGDLPGLKADEDGMVRGSEFEISLPDTVVALAKWAREWKGKIGDDGTADIELRPGVSMSDWANSLETIAQQLQR
jgi:hypothetical protein